MIKIRKILSLLAISLYWISAAYSIDQVPHPHPLIFNQTDSIKIEAAIDESERGSSSSKPNIIQPAPLAKKPWTVLVYIAGDNNLADFIEADLKEMQSIGSSDKLNILAFVSTHRGSQHKMSQQFVINNNHRTEVGRIYDLDSGSNKTVTLALNWATKYYPSDKLMVVLWNHGSGPLPMLRDMEESILLPWEFMPRSMPTQRDVCYDETTGNALNDVKLQQALASINRKIDIVAFDACLMAGVEVAYTLKPYVNYMVASQQTIPGTGYGYERFLGPMAQTDMDPKNVAELMVAAYEQEYIGKKGYTLSAIDLTNLTPVVDGLNNLAIQLSKQLGRANGQQAAYTIWESSNPINCTVFDEPTYIELNNFLSNLLTNVEKIEFDSQQDKTDFLNNLKIEMQALANCIIANVHSDDLRGANGLSIYFPQKTSGFYSSYKKLYWSQKTAWNLLITNYHKFEVIS